MSPLLIGILIVLGILFIFAIVVKFIKWNANRMTTWFSIKKLEIDKPMKEYAELLLDEKGLVDVKVRKIGFFASIFIGNTYSLKKKEIRLAWFVARHPSVTTLAQVCRLVSIAKMHSEGVKGLRAIELNRWLNWLPILFIPLVLIGLIIDLLGGGIGLYTIIFSGIGLVIAIFSLTLSLIAMKKERRAYDMGYKIISEMAILNEQEENKIKKLFSAWKKLVVINTFANLFQAIFFILNLIFAIFRIGRR